MLRGVRRCWKSGLCRLIVTKRSCGTFTASNDSRSQERPLVVVSGWGFAKNDELGRYADLYNKLGYDTLVYKIHDETYYSFNHSIIAREVENICQKINGQLGRSDIVCHALSNSGYTVYQHIHHRSSVLSTVDKNNINIRAAVFDSCPIPSTFIPNILVGELGNLGVTRQMHRNYMNFECFLHSWRVAKEPFVKSLVKGFINSIHLKPSFFFHWSDYSSPGIHAVTVPKEFPQLYIYSRSDSLYAFKLLEIVEERQMDLVPNQNLITTKDFETSSHVHHLDSFPEEYEAVLKEFLKRVKV